MQKTKWTLTSGISIFLSPMVSLAASMTPCDLPSTQGAIHCAYVSPTISEITGKYIKIKESQPNHPSHTKIFCAVAGKFPIMMIPNIIGQRHVGDQVAWQFSQCADKDCSASQLLVDDKFTITKTAQGFSSGPKNKTEVALNPSYGENCNATAANNLNGIYPVINPLIDDMVSLVTHMPDQLNETMATLDDMQKLALKASSGSMNSSDLFALDREYQADLWQITSFAAVQTLSGEMYINGGTMRLAQEGSDAYRWNLAVHAPVSDIGTLNIANTSLENSAEDAYMAVYNAEIALLLGFDGKSSLHLDAKKS